MKKLLGIVMSAAMVFSLAACGATATTSAAASEGASAEASSAAETDAASADLKVGVILVGDETEGYTAAHMEGIKTAAENVGIAAENVIWKYKVPESSECADAAEDLVGQGCDVIISNSYGHQNFMVEVAERYPDVTFVAMTGDFAAVSGLDNFKNAFTRIYESRYVSGVVAGMKLKELTESGALTAETQPGSFDADGNVKIGYVGAYPYAEVVSGYTAFYLGVKSEMPNVVMEVMYTNSWFDIDKEATAAKALINNGAVVIGQHADSTGAPAATQAEKNNGTICYSVGYNIDMLATAPDAALTSATNNWSAYYTELFNAMINGEEVPTNWAKGYDDNAVGITDLGPDCAEGTADKVAEIEAGLKDGSIHVFDTAAFTVGGEKVDSYEFDSTIIDFTTGDVVYPGETSEVITDGYFSESTVRSAPYFDLRIDGITEDADPVA